MSQLSSLARTLFAVAMAAFGVLSLVSGELIRAPVSLTPQPILLYLSAAVLGSCAIAIMVKRFDYLAAIALGIAFGLSFLLLHIPALIAHPRDGNTWALAVATLALCGMSLVLAARCAPATAAARPIRMLNSTGRVMFGLCLLVCGTQHFMYASFVATFIPAWIPMPLLWVYFTGACHLAAGASMITRLWMPLGTLLIGLMFFLFVGLLHVPRVARDSGNPDEWISLFVAVAFCSGAWLLASQAHEHSRASAYTTPLYRPLRLLRSMYHRPAAL
jgi:hypothetical protein